MLSRKAAIRASFMSGSIFGLIPDIKLEVERENQDNWFEGASRIDDHITTTGISS
jgi:hypothetical protein